jgi:hypothetical protein
VLLYQAQEQGLEKDVFRAPLDTIIKGLDFDSNDQALIKKHLRAMVSTTVEWQSPTTGEGSSWNVSGLLAHAKLSKEQGQVWVEWSYAVNLKQELLEPTVFARLRLESSASCGRMPAWRSTRSAPATRTSAAPPARAWRWWYPVLSGNPPREVGQARVPHLQARHAQAGHCRGQCHHRHRRRTGRAQGWAASSARSSSASRPSARPLWR